MVKLTNKLSQLRKEQIIELINGLIAKDDALRIKLQGSLDKIFPVLLKQNKIDEDVNQYHELWDEAESIIDDLNEYGGGPEEDENTVYDNLNDIAELFKKGNLGNQLKKEFIEKCIHFFYLGNSGMDDALVDACFGICKNKEDWLFLIENLKKVNRDYANRLIMEIYKNYLDDNANYLELRMNNLHYGTDYFDLVKFYESKGEKNKAFETAQEGLKKGEGRIIDLLEYLCNHYKLKKDHINTLKYYLLSFREDHSLEMYKKIRDFCTIAEWETVSKELYDSIKKDEYVKRQIDFENKEYKKVFDSITKTEYCFDDAWARKIEQFFPNEFLEMYKKKIKQNIEYKNVASYLTAVNYCFRVKKILDKSNEWYTYLNTLREKYPKLPALQRELKRLDDK